MIVNGVAVVEVTIKCVAVTTTTIGGIADVE